MTDAILALVEDGLPSPRVTKTVATEGPSVRRLRPHPEWAATTRPPVNVRMGPRVAGVPGVAGVEVAGEVAPESRRATDRVGNIVVESLRKEFGATVAVNDLSFDVSSGSVTGFLGPNGAGKTTTLRVLLGLVSATRGRATIDGQPYRELAHPTRKVGAVLEGANFHPGRTARNHMRVVAGAGLFHELEDALVKRGEVDFLESACKESQRFFLSDRGSNDRADIVIERDALTLGEKLGLALQVVTHSQ